MQGWTGGLGLDFRVNSSIMVDQLGVFDNGNLAKLFQDHAGVSIQIYTTAGVAVGPLVSLIPSTPGVTEVGGDAFLAVTPFLLTPGDYSVVAFNVGDYNTLGANPNIYDTMNDGGGLISFIGSGRFSSGSGFPTHVDGGPVDRYLAGTFDFVSEEEFLATPEPSTFAFIGLGLVGLFGAARRKRSA